MRNAAPRGDSMMWCMGDWLMPFLWDMLGKFQRMVLYMPVLWMSQVFVPHRGGLSCISAPRDIGLLLWDVGKDISRGEVFLMV